MPSYNYKCPECGKEVEMLMTISQMETSEIPCPEENCDRIMIKDIGAPAVNMNGHAAVPKGS